MKRWLMVTGMLVAVAGSGFADLKTGDSLIAIFGGAGGSNTHYDLNGPKDRPVTGGGGAFGAQYLYVAKSSPGVAVGVDALSSLNGTFHSNELIGGVNTEARMRSTVVMAIAKLVFPRGTFRPYLFAGLGGHSSSLFLSGQPQAGVSWADGGSDTRVLVDEHKTSVALGYGIGLDAFLNENFFLGLELRGTQLGGLRTRPTAAATAAGFTMEDKGPVEQGNILFRLGWKFGQ